ncbi:MAG: PCMD domain-containing protein, partial [Duncaniella sp.]|nr:PCMD domain-containing protein [Duncaniella sp.]
INVEPEPVEGTSVSEIIALAPQFQGADGLDIDAPILREPGAAGRISFQIIGSSQLTGVKLESDILQPLIGTNACDLMAMDANSVQILSDKGIMFVPVDKRTDEDKADGEFVPTNMHVSLEETFMNSLEEGEYTLLVTATDAKGKSSTQTICFNITQVPGIVGASDIPEASYTTATLVATVMKPGDRMGFEVKSAGPARAYEDWTFVPGDLDGDKLTATISDLQAGFKYDYRLIVDDYVSQAFTVQTPAYPQLPNAGFEEWSKLSSNNKVTLLCADENNMFWDSGNHGSATMSKLVTDQDASVKHSGNYSAKLKSQFVGVGSIGRFAAGNAFVGKYLKTDGTDGELGWGRPW